MKNLVDNLFYSRYIMVEETKLVKLLDDLDRFETIVRRCLFEKDRFYVKIRATNDDWEEVKEQLRSKEDLGEILVANGLDLQFKELLQGLFLFAKFTFLIMRT